MSNVFNPDIPRKEDSCMHCSLQVVLLGLWDPTQSLNEMKYYSWVTFIFICIIYFYCLVFPICRLIEMSYIIKSLYETTNIIGIQNHWDMLQSCKTMKLLNKRRLRSSLWVKCCWWVIMLSDRPDPAGSKQLDFLSFHVSHYWLAKGTKSIIKINKTKIYSMERYH